MPTRNVVLTQYQEDFIERLVAGGRYQNASEVLREGIRLVAAREREDVAKIEALRAAAQLGIDAIERGEYKEFTEDEEMRAYLRGIADRVLKRSTSE